MTFARFQDEFYPEYVEGKGLSGAALAVHVAATLKAVSFRSDGIITDAHVSTICTQLKLRSRARIIDELIGCGLWEDLGERRYQVDWTHQKTADQVMRDRTSANERQADYRERESRCKAGDHSMCIGTKRRCQQGRNNNVSDALHSSPAQSSPVRSDPARDKDLDLGLDLGCGKGDEETKGLSGTDGRPAPDQPRLGFAHHPDGYAPGGASPPEAALWSAPAGDDASVEALEGPGGGSMYPEGVKTAQNRDLGAEKAIGVRQESATGQRMPIEEAFRLGLEALDVRQTKNGATIQLVKSAWKAWESGNRSEWLTAAKEIAYYLPVEVEAAFPAAEILEPSSGAWPVRIEYDDPDRLARWIDYNKSFIAEIARDDWRPTWDED